MIRGLFKLIAILFIGAGTTQLCFGLLLLLFGREVWTPNEFVLAGVALLVLAGLLNGVADYRRIDGNRSHKEPTLPES